MGRRHENHKAARELGQRIRAEQQKHHDAVAALKAGDPSKVDARIAELAAKLPDVRALKTRLFLQPDVNMRQASFAMIYPHLTFRVTNDDLEDVECYVPEADDAPRKGDTFKMKLVD